MGSMPPANVRRALLLALLAAGCSDDSTSLPGPALDAGALDAGAPPPRCQGPATVAARYSADQVPIDSARILVRSQDVVLLVPRYDGDSVPAVVTYARDPSDETTTERALEDLRGTNRPWRLRAGPAGETDFVAFEAGRTRGIRARWGALGDEGQDAVVSLADHELLRDVDTFERRIVYAVTAPAPRADRLRVASGTAVHRQAVEANAGIRLFVRAGLIAIDEREGLSMLPFDFDAARPAGEAWRLDGCEGEAQPRDVEAIGAGPEVILAYACRDVVRVERRDRATGRLAVARAIDAPAGRSAAVGLARDAAGRIVLGRWLGPSGPSLFLLDDALANVRAPVTLPDLDHTSAVPAALELSAAPDAPGEVALAFTTVLGHGAGILHVARARLCAP